MTIATPWKTSTLWYIYIHDNRYTSADDFKNNSTGCIVYPLTTPIELDVSSVEIPTINGKNNIFADTGDMEVKYFLTVGKKIN